MLHEQDAHHSVSPQEEAKIQMESDAYPQMGAGVDYDPLAIYKSVDEQLQRSQYESDESKARVL